MLHIPTMESGWCKSAQDGSVLKPFGLIKDGVPTPGSSGLYPFQNGGRCLVQADVLRAKSDVVVRV